MKVKELSKEMRALRELLKTVPEDRKAISDSLFREIVFMEQTLLKLKEEIKENGATELFKQGKQEFIKESASLKGYNTTVQRFSLLFKQIMELLPPTEVEKADELMDFIK